MSTLTLLDLDDVNSLYRFRVECDTALKSNVQELMLKYSDIVALVGKNTLEVEISYGRIASFANEFQTVLPKCEVLDYRVYPGECNNSANAMLMLQAYSTFLGGHVAAV